LQVYSRSGTIHEAPAPRIRQKCSKLW
jgi:hypothetical protein